MGTIPKVPVTKKGGQKPPFYYLAATTVAVAIWTHNYIFKLIPIEQINAPLAIARVFGLLPNCWPCHIILTPDIVMMPIPPIIANRFILFHKRLLRKLIHQLDQFHLQLLQY